MLNFNHFFIADWEKVRGEQEVRSYYALGLMILLAGGLHFFLGVYFFLFGIRELTVYNLAGLTFLFAMFQFSRKGHHNVSSILATVEVVVFTIVCTAWFGWPSSCQWYIITALLPHFLFVKSSSNAKAFVAVVCAGGMFSIFFYTCFYPPINPLGETLVLRFLNLSVIAAALTLEIKMNDLVQEASSRKYQQHINNLQRDVLIDPLTGLWNRRYIKAYFDQMSSSEPPVYCITIIDIDHFKDINDTYGHDVGDDVLCQVSKMLLDRFRTTDVAVRWGGEEFLIMLRNVDLATGTKIMNDFRAKLEETIFTSGEYAIRLSITAGVAEFSPNSDDDFHEIVRLGDACLYYGKANGRNQVVNSGMVDPLFLKNFRNYKKD